MNIVELRVAGFRGFAREAHFDLRGNVIVLHGENGTGKTSFFDAIVWALTGCIARFKGNEDDVISRYSPTLSATVTLTLFNPQSSELIRVTRTSDQGSAKFVSLEMSGKTVKGDAADAALRELLWVTGANDRDISLGAHRRLTRSIYLQQDLVREFIDAADATTRFEIVSDLIGSTQALDLQERLESTRRAWSKHVNELQVRLDNSNRGILTLNDQIERLRVDGEDDISSLTALWREWRREHGRLFPEIQTSEEFDPPASLAFVESRVVDILAAESGLSRQVATVQSLRDTASGIINGETDEAIMAALEAEIAIKEKSFVEQRKEAVALLARSRDLALAHEKSLSERQERADLARLALKHLGDHCPVCTQEHDQEVTQRHLIVLAAQATEDTTENAELKIVREQVQQLRAGAMLAEQELAEVRAEVNMLRQKQGETARLRAWNLEKVRELGYAIDPSEPYENFLHQTTAAVERELQAVEHHRRDAERILLALTKLRESSRRAALETQLASLKMKYDGIVLESQRAQRAQKVMTEIIDGIREATVKFTRQCIEVIEPLVQRLYTRIEPHPTFRLIKFWSGMSRGRGHLNPQLIDPMLDLEESDPLRVLSSSQLNALALSIFTALNLGVRGSPLKVLMLDEPLQSLDDLNLLGLIDALRRLKDGRQLILSTHNTRLVDLLSRKLRPVKDGDRTMFYSLTSWDREGPEIMSQEIPPSRKPFVVAA